LIISKIHKYIKTKVNKNRRYKLNQENILKEIFINLFNGRENNKFKNILIAILFLIKK